MCLPPFVTTPESCWALLMRQPGRLQAVRVCLPIPRLFPLNDQPQLVFMVENGLAVCNVQVCIAGHLAVLLLLHCRSASCGRTVCCRRHSSAQRQGSAALRHGRGTPGAAAPGVPESSQQLAVSSEFSEISRASRLQKTGRL